jgi:hypothetical protein
MWTTRWIKTSSSLAIFLLLTLGLRASASDPEPNGIVNDKDTRYGSFVLNKLEVEGVQEQVAVSKRTVTRAIRLLGLGSSSTEGTGSQPKDGYRKPLRDLLEQSGHEISFNGPFCHGILPDSSHAGRGGDTLGAVGII